MKLSPSNGVNPTCGVCWYCMQDTGELFLTGAAGDRIAKDMGKRDGQMPMRTVMNREPCNSCKALMTQGVMLVEVVPGSQDKPERGDAMAVVKDHVISQLINDEKLVEGILAKRLAFIPTNVWDALGLPRENADHRSETATKNEEVADECK